MDMNWFKKGNQFLLVFFFGLTLVFIGLIIWFYSTFQIQSFEQIVNDPSVSSDYRWRAVGSLEWWRNFYSTVSVPTTFSLVILGIVIIVSLVLSVSPELRSYLKSGNARWFRFVLLFLAFTILMVFGISEDSFPLVFLRYFFGLVFTLWFPGYCFIRAIFTSTSDESLKHPNSLEKIGLVLVSSLAIVPLFGLILNYTPWGINLVTVMGSLIFVTIVFSTIAVVKEYTEYRKFLSIPIPDV
jgi:hypothetical protein